MNFQEENFNTPNTSFSDIGEWADQTQVKNVQSDLEMDVI